MGIKTVWLPTSSKYLLFHRRKSCACLEEHRLSKYDRIKNVDFNLRFNKNMCFVKG